MSEKTTDRSDSESTIDPESTDPESTEPGSTTGSEPSTLSTDGAAEKADGTTSRSTRLTKASGAASATAGKSKAASAGTSVAGSAKPGSAKPGSVKPGSVKPGSVKPGSAKSSSSAPAADPASRRAGRRSGLVSAIVALGIIVVLLLVALGVELIKGPSAAAKLVKTEDRREAARHAADTAVARLFSFDYKKLDADLAAQRSVTIGPFTGEVDKVTGPALRPIAAKEHVVVQAVSLGSAVLDENNGSVDVLVFLNQAVTLDLLPAPRLDRNRVIATMQQDDKGVWKVAGIKAL